jgi:hypothetical protein
MNGRGLAILLLCAASTFCQLAVVSGKDPVFPKKIDAIVFSIGSDKAHIKNKLPRENMPPDFYENFKAGIDSTIHYVDAVRLKRKELGGNAHGAKFLAYLKFFSDTVQIVKVSFAENSFRSALLDLTTAKYPFVAVFKPALAKKLQIEYRKLRRKKT